MEPPASFDLLDPDQLDALLRPLRQGGRVQFPALGRSMWPVLRSGDALVIEAVGAPRPGDILVVRTGPRLVVHRLLREVAGRYLLKGDFNRVADPPVERSAIVGRAVEFLRDGRRWRLDGVLARAYGVLMARASPATGALADRSRKLRRQVVAAAVGPLAPATRRVWPLPAAVAPLPPARLKAYLTHVAARGEAVGAGRFLSLEAGLEDGSAALFGASDAAGRLIASAECSSLVREGGVLTGTWLRSVWVSPLYRRRGLAGALVEGALEFAREVALPELWLAVDSQNLEAIRIYERRGFARRVGSAEREQLMLEAGMYPSPRHALAWRPG